MLRPYLNSADLRSGGVGDVLELRDPDRAIGKPRDDLEFSAERLDVGPEGADVHVRSALELGDEGLLGAEGFRQGFLRESAGLAQGLERHLGEHRFGPLVGPFAALRGHAGAEVAEFLSHRSGPRTPARPHIPTRPRSATYDPVECLPSTTRTRCVAPSSTRGMAA